MTDHLELDSLFSHHNLADESSYEKVEYIQLTDSNGTNYSGGQLMYLTDPVMKNHIVLSESYLQVPMQLAFAAGAAGRIAVKNSLLSLIQGVIIETGNGGFIANEIMSTPIVANMNLLLDSSIDFIDGNSVHYFGKDTFIEPNVSGIDRSVIGGVDAKVTSILPNVAPSVLSTSPFRNPAFASRISVFSTVASAIALVGAVPTQSFVAYIPLHFIHNFFKVMDFPMVNLSLKLTFNFSGIAGFAGYQPFTIPTYPAYVTSGPVLAAPTGVPNIIAATAGAAAAAAGASPATLIGPVATQFAAATPISIVANLIDVHGTVNTPKLFLKSVTFRAPDAIRLKNEIMRGYEKEIVYSVSNFYTFPNTAAQIQQPIGTAIVKPTRMWVFPLPQGTLASSANSFPASIGPNFLTNFNIQLNGNNFYNNQFTTQYQFYREFKTQCIAAGSSTASGTPIGYTDWLSGHNPYVFDLSRNPTVKSNNQCALVVSTDVRPTGTPGGLPAAYDLVVVVERLLTLVMNVSEGGVILTTKPGSA